MGVVGDEGGATVGHNILLSQAESFLPKTLVRREKMIEHKTKEDDANSTMQHACASNIIINLVNLLLINV